jgi:hypothetical protein
VIRFLLLLGLIYILYLVITKPLGELFGGIRRSRSQMPKSSPKKPALEAEEMAACSLCGTFISKREGEMRDGKFACKPHCHA